MSPKIILSLIALALFQVTLQQATNVYPNTYSFSSQAIANSGGTWNVKTTMPSGTSGSRLSYTTNSGTDNWKVSVTIDGNTAVTSPSCTPSATCANGVTVTTSSDVTVTLTCNNPVNPCSISGSVSWTGVTPFLPLFGGVTTVNYNGIDSAFVYTSGVSSVLVGTTPVLGYDIAVTPQGSIVEYVQSITAPSGSVTFTGKLTYGTHSWRYRAKNSDGASSWSGSSTFTNNDPAYQASVTGAVVGSIIGILACCCCIICTPIIIILIIAMATGGCAGMMAGLCGRGNNTTVVSNNISNSSAPTAPQVVQPQPQQVVYVQPQMQQPYQPNMQPSQQMPQQHYV
jgi:hypothetical protein